MTILNSPQYKKNLERAISEFRQGNITKSGDYMDKNYLILFNQYHKIGDVLNQVKERLKEAYLNETTKSSLLELSNSLNQLFTLRGNQLREYTELQQTGEIPTNCPG